MIIYPAIDLRKGQCIRLYQGDYNRETVYHSDPFAMAQYFISQGAHWLHVVDLDGAQNPEANQIDLISAIIKRNNVRIQTGGGIRTKAQVKNLLDKGAARVIIGSLAVKNQKEVKEWFNFFGADRIVLALDIITNANSQYSVATNAWQNISDYSLYDLVESYQSVGLTHLLCTNIALDGTLNGPDFNLYDNLSNKFPWLNLQASGGIHSLSDVITLRENKLHGAIIGRALYEKKFTLSEALSC